MCLLSTTSNRPPPPSESTPSPEFLSARSSGSCSKEALNGLSLVQRLILRHLVFDGHLSTAAISKLANMPTSPGQRDAPSRNYAVNVPLVTGAERPKRWIKRYRTEVAASASSVLSTFLAASWPRGFPWQAAANAFEALSFPWIR